MAERGETPARRRTAPPPDGISALPVPASAQQTMRLPHRTAAGVAAVANSRSPWQNLLAPLPQQKPSSTE